MHTEAHSCNHLRVIQTSQGVAWVGNSKVEAVPAVLVRDSHAGMAQGGTGSAPGGFRGV